MRGLHGQVRSRHAGVGDVALRDPCALQDPLIVRLDHLLQVIVGEHALGHVTTQRADFDFTHGSSRLKEAANDLDMLNSREMQVRQASLAPDQAVSALQSTLFFETSAEIYARVFRELKPRTKPPAIRVEFRPFANADSFIRMTEDEVHVRIADVLEGCPAPVMEALAHILF